MAAKKKESLDLSRLLDSACNFLDAYADNLRQIADLRAKNEERLNKKADEILNQILGPIPAYPKKQADTQPEFDDLTKVFGK